MGITAVLILITTNEEMEKNKTGITEKEVQLEHDFVSIKTVQKGLL